MEDSINQDLEIYGIAYEYKDDNGNIIRIDPTRIRTISKKEEETQEQIWRDAIEDIVDPRTAFEKGKNIDYLMTKFEIQRKPL